MRRGSIIVPVLKLLSKSREGLILSEIANALPDIEDVVSLHVILSNNCNYKNGIPKIRTDGKKKCNTCFSSHLSYRITDEGRIYLASKVS